MLVGGAESMSRAPWVLPKTEKPYPAGDMTLVSTTLGWRLVNPAMRPDWTVSLGEATERLAEKYGVGRRGAGRVLRDLAQPRRRGVGRGVLRPARHPGPGHGPGPGRGHPCRVLRREARRAQDRVPDRERHRHRRERLPAVRRRVRGLARVREAPPACSGLEPLARIAGRGAHANDPQFFGYAPVEAANKALAKAGIGWDQVGAVELNEAFAAQSLACINAWGIDPAIVNRHGGAIAMGHPLGASGGRILGTLARSLQASGERWGVAAICIGVGQGLAIVLENMTVAGTNTVKG